MKTILLFLSVFLSANLFGQNVYIPDANFKAYLVGNSLINTNNDTEIQVSEASSFDGWINCEYQNISDLTGIEAFTSLWQLSCSNNQLTSLDVSQNTALIYLGCSNNQLTILDVSQNTALETLRCSNNQLTSLDVSQNNALELLVCQNLAQLTSINLNGADALVSLWCSANQLTSLDVSQNTALIDLDCALTLISRLDVSQNPNLGEFTCQGNLLTCLNVANGNNSNLIALGVENNPNLTCIEVDDANWANANWANPNGTYSGDPQMYFSEDCNNDCSSTSNLTELTTSKNLIQILDLMGRETSFKPNTPLIYVYDDGSTEKVFSVEY